MGPPQRNPGTLLGRPEFVHHLTTPSIPVVFPLQTSDCRYQGSTRSLALATFRA